MRHTTLLALLLLISATSLPAIVRQAHAAGTLYISPGQVAQKSVGSTFKIQVKVASMDAFNAWDIEVNTDPAVLNATSFTIYPNLFKNYTVPAANFYEATHCINGGGYGCSNSTDGPGVVHSTLTLLQPPPQTTPSTGLLFTITYQVVSIMPYSAIEIQNDVLVNGATITRVTHSTIRGVYGTPVNPDFSISSSPPTLDIAHGSSENVTITLAGVGPFSGPVQLTARTNATGLTVTPAQTTLSLKLHSTNSTSLRVSAASSVPVGPLYYVNVTGSAGASLKHSLYLLTTAYQPGIKLGITPNQLLLHAGDSGTSTVFVNNVFNFTGPVSLRASVSSDISNTSKVTTTFGSTTLQLVPNGEANTTLTVYTPPSFYRFSYTVTIYANGSSVSDHKDLSVLPPPGDLHLTVNPSVITTQAGKSVNATVNIASVDYLYGAVNVAASMSSGAVRLNTTTFLIPPSFTPRNFNVTLNIAIDANTLAGSYNLTLTVYTLCFTPANLANNCQPKQDSLRYTENLSVTVTPGSEGSSQPPSVSTILGLAPPLYFGILGVLALLFVVLSVQTYRKSRE